MAKKAILKATKTGKTTEVKVVKDAAKAKSDVLTNVPVSPKNKNKNGNSRDRDELTNKLIFGKKPAQVYIDVFGIMNRRFDSVHACCSLIYAEKLFKLIQMIWSFGGKLPDLSLVVNERGYPELQAIFK